MRLTMPKSPSLTWNSLAAGLMILTLLLAGSTCDESQTNRTTGVDSYTRVGPDGTSTTNRPPPSGQADQPTNDPLADGRNDSPDNPPGHNDQPTDSQDPLEENPLGGEQPEADQACGNSDRICTERQDCVAGTCVDSGPLRISMFWRVATDIDLHILTPTGEALSYRSRNTADGGLFAGDTCIGGSCDLEDGGAIVETAHWSDEPTHGEYEFWAVNYTGSDSVEVHFEILIDGVISTFTTTVAAEARVESEHFKIQYPTEEEERDAGTFIGEFIHTYYYLADETQYSGSATTTLYDSQCRAMAQVSASFSDSVCIEGSGKLRDGTIINYASTCSCGRRCPTGGTVCYSKLDANRFPWGKGNRNNPLDPFRSIAVDRNVIANGTILYMEEWDGVAIPSVDGIGGFTHDGCFRADDVGGAIRGQHYDFFAGTKDMWRALEPIRPTRTKSKVYKDSERCAHVN